MVLTNGEVSPTTRGEAPPLSAIIGNGRPTGQRRLYRSQNRGTAVEGASGCHGDDGNCPDGVGNQLGSATLVGLLLPSVRRVQYAPGHRLPTDRRPDAEQLVAIQVSGTSSQRFRWSTVTAPARCRIDTARLSQTRCRGGGADLGKEDSLDFARLRRFHQRGCRRQQSVGKATSTVTWKYGNVWVSRVNSS